MVGCKASRLVNDMDYALCYVRYCSCNFNDIAKMEELKIHLVMSLKGYLFLDFYRQYRGYRVYSLPRTSKLLTKFLSGYVLSLQMKALASIGCILELVMVER